MTHIERGLAKQLQSSVKFVLIAFCGLGAVSSSISATSAYTINDRQNNRVYRRNPQTKRTAGSSSPVVVGRASWYGNASAGRKTATGERLDPRCCYESGQWPLSESSNKRLRTVHQRPQARPLQAGSARTCDDSRRHGARKVGSPRNSSTSAREQEVRLIAAPVISPWEKVSLAARNLRTSSRAQPR
jgi:hypothetical protein